MSYQPLSLYQLCIDAVIEKETGLPVRYDWHLPPGYFDHLAKLTRTMHHRCQSNSDPNYVLVEHVDIHRATFVYPTVDALIKLIRMFTRIFKTPPYGTIHLRPCEPFQTNPYPIKFVLIMSMSCVNADHIAQQHRRVCPYTHAACSLYFQHLFETYQTP